VTTSLAAGAARVGRDERRCSNPRNPTGCLRSTDGKVTGGYVGTPSAERMIPSLTADATENIAKGGSFRVKKAYVRLAVLSSSLMALLLAGGANIKRT
jgi:hypothetical protein